MRRIGLLSFLLIACAAAAEDATPAKLSLDAPVCAEPSRGYGYFTEPSSGKVAFHAGADFNAPPTGLDVRASAAGAVVVAEVRGGYGLLVEIDHGQSVRTRYGGLREALVKAGDAVKAGQVIGRIAADGRSSEPRALKLPDILDPTPPASPNPQVPHLHYEIWVWNVVRDPLSLFCPSAGCMKPRPRYNPNLPDWPLATEACK